MVGIDDKVTVTGRRIFGFAGQLTFRLPIFVDHFALIDESRWYLP